MTMDAAALLALLPATERRDAADGLLAALIEAIGGELAIVDRDLDQLYDDLFIETCADWVAPYIGALIGYRPLSGPSASLRSPRAEVADTIALRRAKGTLSAVDKLARSITGWQARVREAAPELARTQHLNFQAPDRVGTASLRAPLPAMLAAPAFLRLPRTVDVRTAARGLWNLPNILIDLFPYLAVPLVDADAATIADRHYGFDPLGRDVALFAPGSAAADARADTPDEVAMPISRRLLDLRMASGVAPDRPVFAIRIDGVPIDATLCQVCDLSGWSDPWPGMKAAIDPELGRFVLADDPGTARISVDWWHAAAATVDRAAFPLGAGGWQQDEPDGTAVARGDDLATAADGMTGDRALRLTDSAVYAGDLAIGVPAGMALAISAGSGARPVIAGTLTVTLGAGATIALAGLLIGGGVVIEGEGGVTGERLTLLPAGDGAALRWTSGSGGMVHLSASASGPIRVGHLVDVVLEDSVVDGDLGDDAGAPGGLLDMDRATITGAARMRAIGDISNAIVADALVLDRTQSGCVRYSYLGPGSVAPGGFRRQPDTAIAEASERARTAAPSITPAALAAIEAAVRHAEAPIFSPPHHGGPGLAELDARSGATLRRGGEDGGEMGMWNGLGTPFRRANLEERLREFIRIGFVAGVNDQGRGQVL